MRVNGRLNRSCLELARTLDFSILQNSNLLRNHDQKIVKDNKSYLRFREELIDAMKEDLFELRKNWWYFWRNE